MQENVHNMQENMQNKPLLQYVVQRHVPILHVLHMYALPTLLTGCHGVSLLTPKDTTNSIVI